MRILHIGDFHFKGNKNKYDQNNIVSKLITHLKGKEKIDFIFFSGDLVFNGNKEDFINAHELLFAQLIKELDINIENIFICAGNHDINRADSSNAIINFFSGKDSKIKNNEDLNNWINIDKKDLEISLLPSQNYFEYVRKYFSKNAEKFTELITIHKREYGGKSIAIITLNSSWLSSAFQKDEGNLLFPTNIIKDAISLIDKSDIKVIMLHHPLYLNKEYNYLDLQDLIHRNFNIMFAGHVHRERIETQYNSLNGIYCNTTQASLCNDKGEIGFSILNIDINDLQTIRIERSHYIPKENSYLDLEPVIVTIPCGEEKFRQNKLRNKITKKFDVELETSNQLLLNYDDDNKRGFLDTFTDPVLSSSSEADSSTGSSQFVFNFNELLEASNNYLIFGNDKCGKTSLLKRIQLHHLKNFSNKGLIPFYIDYKDYENTNSLKFDFVKRIAQYYEINHSESTEIANGGRLILLIDNLNPQSAIHIQLVKLLSETPKLKFIFCSEYLATRVLLEELDDLKYEKIYFKNLTRKEIKLYAQKQPSLSEENENTINEKIANFCTQLELPLNYWTISLILLIYKKHNDDYNKNLFSVIDACVDEILNKKKFAIEKTNLKFEQYKVLCSQIAHQLLIDYRENEYSAEYLELIGIVEESIKKNLRIVATSKDIIDYLLQVGILKRKNNNRYTFRLNGIFEYFLAFFIKDHPGFKKELLLDDAIYLSFKNELELYAGFRRNDVDLLKEVLEKTKTKFDPIILKFTEHGSIDSNLINKITSANDFNNTVKKLILNNSIQDEVQNELMDTLNPLNTSPDVHKKEILDVSQINFEILEKYLSILSRVFKNLDSIEELEIINDVFDYLLECYCNLGFYVIDEFEGYAISENLNKIENTQDEYIIGGEILVTMSKIIPVLMSSMLYDGIGHLNIKRIVEDKIKELNSDFKNNQYKLFLLYFLFIDLDIENNKEIVDEIFSKINLAALKVSTLFKLNFYLGFKSYKNKKLENYFKNKVQAAQLRLDNKINPDGLQKGLAEKQKGNLIKTLNR